MADTIHLRLFITEFLQLDESWNGRNRRNSFWRLYFNDTEGAEIHCGDNLYRVPAERFFLLPAGVHFDYTIDARCHPFPRHFYIHFDIPGLAGFRLREAFDVPIAMPFNPPLEAEATLLRERVSPDSLADFALGLRLQSLIFGVLGAAWDHLPVEKQERVALFSAEHQGVAPALEHIEKNLGQPLRNERLAALCHLSCDHFIRRFKAATRHSPQKYILERRVALAAQKLLFSGDSIERIAVDCGFANRFYFSRLFTQCMEISPAAFRRDGTRW